jgi:hypothetical protein
MDGATKMKPTQAYALVLEDGRMIIDTANKSEVEAATGSQGGIVRRVEIVDAQKRSLSANALFHVWCGEIGKHLGYSAEETKNVLKHRFGVKHLLMTEKGDAVKYILDRIGYYTKMNWSQQQKVLENLAVTSVMTTSELKGMMQEIKEWCISEHQLTLSNGDKE